MDGFYGLMAIEQDEVESWVSRSCLASSLRWGKLVQGGSRASQVWGMLEMFYLILMRLL